MATTIFDPTAYEWMALAECKGHEKLFFIPEGRGFDPRPAQRICKGQPELGIPPCPVRSICLNQALEKGDIHVIRGGMTDEERKQERRKRQKRARRTPTAPNNEDKAAPAPTQVIMERFTHNSA